MRNRQESKSSTKGKAIYLGILLKIRTPTKLEKIYKVKAIENLSKVERNVFKTKTSTQVGDIY